jgi:hypothetical protein
VSGFADYEQYDALGLADLVRRKAVSLLETAIERVDARNAAANAVVSGPGKQEINVSVNVRCLAAHTTTLAA